MDDVVRLIENDANGASTEPNPKGHEVMRLKAAASGAEKKMKKNPALKFKHIHGVRWNAFIAKIANNFHYDIKSRSIFNKLITLESEEHLPFAHKDEDEINLLDVLIDNTNFDIRHANTPTPPPDTDFGGIALAGITKPTPDTSLASNKSDDDEKEDKAARKLRHARLEVFDTMLSEEYIYFLYKVNYKQVLKLCHDRKHVH